MNSVEIVQRSQNYEKISFTVLFRLGARAKLICWGAEKDVFQDPLDHRVVRPFSARCILFIVSQGRIRKKCGN